MKKMLVLSLLLLLAAPAFAREYTVELKSEADQPIKVKITLYNGEKKEQITWNLKDKKEVQEGLKRINSKKWKADSISITVSGTWKITGKLEAEGKELDSAFDFDYIHLSN